jgi:hypothetical protein
VARRNINTAVQKKLRSVILITVTEATECKKTGKDPLDARTEETEPKIKWKFKTTERK